MDFYQLNAEKYLQYCRACKLSIDQPLESYIHGTSPEEENKLVT